MVITRRKENGQLYRYFLNGKRIGVDALARICRKYLTEAGMDAMWRQAIDNKKCVLELAGVDEDENTLLNEKIAELEMERVRNAKLEKKLIETKLQSADYILKHV